MTTGWTIAPTVGLISTVYDRVVNGKGESNVFPKRIVVETIHKGSKKDGGWVKVTGK